MTNIEARNEKIRPTRKGSLKTEKELTSLKSNTRLTNLRTEIKKAPKKWIFEFKNTSKNWEYKVYAYTIAKHWTPSILKYQAVQKWIAKSKDQVIITDINWKEYGEWHKFSVSEKVYVKIKTKPQTKPQSKPSNAEIKPNPQRIDTQKPELWKLEYKNTSRDWKFEVYSYTVDSSTTSQWAISSKAQKELNLKNTRWLEITDSKWEKYGPNKKFKIWEKIYLRIPVTIENDVQIIDWMKRKWWEYFWIDISKFNEDIDLNKFKTRNRKKRDSKKKDVRWVSFTYIRASDWVTKDKKLENHINKIKLYNNDPSIKANHEKIAVWFYHRMDYHSAEENANTFIRNYNNNKNNHWWNNLIPMLDLEADWNSAEHKVWKKRPKLSKAEAQKKAKKCLEIIERKTWVIPWIYTTVSIYNNYFLNDNRFNKYKKRIAAYPPSYKQGQGPNGWREIANGPSRINHKTWAVNLWTKNIYPEMYQSSQEWSVDGAYAIIIENRRTKYEKKYHDTDMDHTKDITKLFSKNNRSN